jgi:hypothetical protein
MLSRLQSPCCPTCGQSVTRLRLGVKLTPLKLAIFDLVKAAGDEGISSQAIIHELYGNRRDVLLTCVKSHAFQINELLSGTEWVLTSDRRNWFLRRRDRKRTKWVAA